jgi:hypothetical protein
MTDTVDKYTFYRGLLFALRANGVDEFPAAGPAFHEAFGKTIEYASEISAAHHLPKPIIVNVDPIYGVYPEANEMLLEGEQDLVLSLMNPRLKFAQFKIDRAEADEELKEVGYEDWYRELAKFFHSHVTSGRGSEDASEADGRHERSRDAVQ